MIDETKKVLARIKKMLAMANDARGNEQENATAAAKAAELMAEHKLAMVDVESYSAEDQVGEGGLDVDFPGARRAGWTDALVVYVCRLNSCKPIMGGPNGERFKIIGKAMDVEVVRATFTFLAEQIVRLSREWGIENEQGRGPRINFRVGCMHRVCDRLEEQRDRMATSPRYGEMIVVGDRAVSAYIAEHYPHLRKQSRRSKRGDGFNAGFAAGDKVSLGGIGSNGARGAQRQIR